MRMPRVEYGAGKSNAPRSGSVIRTGCGRQMRRRAVLEKAPGRRHQGTSLRFATVNRTSWLAAPPLAQPA